MLLRTIIFLMLLGGEISSLKAQNDSLSNEEPSPSAFFLCTKDPQPINLKDIVRLIGCPNCYLCYEASIVFRVLVDEKGNYVRHLPPKKGLPFVIKAIEEHIAKLRFIPATRDDIPVKSWANIPFVFKLE